MVHFPADYSHELYGSLHHNTTYMILFNSPGNILNPESKENDKSSLNGHNILFLHLLWKRSFHQQT